MTAQMHEILVLDGRRMGMAFCPPLPSPERQRRGSSDDETQAARRGRWRQLAASAEEGSVGRLIGSTGCRRRYRGTWEIIDARLYLMHVEGKFERAGELPLLADWFTGVLRVPSGRTLLYVHMGFGSVYETELHIRIEQGRVSGRRVYDNRGRTFHRHELEMENLPGLENEFPGDLDLDGFTPEGAPGSRTDV
jgi:hypothetical protein